MLKLFNTDFIFVLQESQIRRKNENELCIYKDLIMTTFPCKSNKRRCKKKKKKKKKSISCPYEQNFSYLLKINRLYDKICTLLPLNNMLRKVYKNFQSGINLQIFGAL